MLIFNYVPNYLEKAKEILRDLNLAITGIDLRKGRGNGENGDK